MTPPSEIDAESDGDAGEYEDEEDTPPGATGGGGRGGFKCVANQYGWPREIFINDTV